MFCKQYDDYCAYLVIMVIMMCIPYENDCYDYGIDAHTL